MSERQTPETVERSSDPIRVNKDRAQGWGSDDTKVDAIRTVTFYPGSENPQEAISPFGWLSAWKCCNFEWPSENGLTTVNAVVLSG